MAFSDLLKGLFPSFQVKNQAIPTVKFGGNGLTLISSSGDAYIKDGYKKNPTVYSLINIILREYCKGKYYAVRNGERIDEHPVLDLFNNPNPNQGRAEFLEEQLGNKLITGEFFTHMVWPNSGLNAGKPIQLWNISPTITDFKTDPFGTPVYYEIESSSSKVKIPSEEMIYGCYWNPDGKRGQSRLEAACATLQQSNDAYEANMRLLQNTGAMGILSSDEDDQYGDQLTEAQRDQIEARYYEKYGGLDNYGRIMITSAKLKWQQIGLKAVDLALLESQQLSKEDLAMVYGVPMELIVSGTTYDNRQSSRKELINNVIIPEHELALGEYNRQLVPRYDDIDELKLDTSVWPELEEDKAAQAAWVKDAYWMKFNEKRKEMGLEEVTEPIGNEYHIPNNLVSDISVDEQIKLLDADYFGNK